MSDELAKKNNSSDFDQSVGEVVTFVGLKGIMKVRPSSNNPGLFLNIKNVLLRSKRATGAGEETIAKVKHIALVKNNFQIQLAKYDSRTAVEPFVKAQIFTPKSELTPLTENEWWVSDLIGLNVYTKEGKLVGTICDAPGENGEFLEIKKANDPQGKTVIVSFVKQIFPVVDLKSQRVEIQAPPGLLD